MLERLVNTTSMETALSRGAPSARAQSFNQNFTKSENISHLNGGRHVARPYWSHPRDAFASHRSFTPDVAPLFKENEQ